MFDIIGKVVSIEHRSTGQYSWTEIVIRESSADEAVTPAAETNDIPLRFPRNFSVAGIEENAWVKARFSLVSRIGRDKRFLNANGVEIKLLYAAKVEEKKNEIPNEGSGEMPF